MFDTRVVRKDFPILRTLIGGKPLVYLDSTATSLKPQSVLDAINGYYTTYTGNINRGIYKISEEATAQYEKAREKVAAFIHARNKEEIVFTRNTTESINLVAAGFGKAFQKDDEVVVSIMEHHSNFVPWQQRALRKGVHFRIWNINQNYQLNTEYLDKLITRKTKLLAITAASNVLGIITPIQEIVHIVKRINPNCAVIVDAAQAVPHFSVDVQGWNADAVAFSGHKMLGPTGVGVLWAKMDLLEKLPPYQYGGDMIKEVHIDHTVFNEVPQKFEAGTPHIAGVIGLGAAVDYLSNLGMAAVRKHEKEITTYALNVLSDIHGLTIVGPKNSDKRGGVVTFTMKGIHPHDIAQILDEDNICIRVGFHCAQPLHEYLKIGPTARASFYVYTTKQDIDVLVKGLEKIKKIFA